MKKLNDELDKLALEIVEGVLGTSEIDSKVDAFKAVSGYVLGLMKKQSGKDESDSQSNRPTFSQLQKRINLAVDNEADTGS